MDVLREVTYKHSLHQERSFIMHKGRMNVCKEEMTIIYIVQIVMNPKNYKGKSKTYRVKYYLESPRCTRKMVKAL